MQAKVAHRSLGERGLMRCASELTVGKPRAARKPSEDARRRREAAEAQIGILDCGFQIYDSIADWLNAHTSARENRSSPAPVHKRRGFFV